MRHIFQKTFGGLSPAYYFRHLVFGLFISGVLVYLLGSKSDYSFMFIVLLSTLLYPYSRFVYESIVGFIFGNNVFIVRTELLLFTKLFTVLLCYSLAMLVAPIGLLYLYYYHSRQEKGNQ